MAKRLIKITFIIIISLFCLNCNAQEKKQNDDRGITYVPFYNEWSGINCKYKGDRPFSFITNIYELHDFWQKSGLKEPEPYIDFEKFMIFLWTPGASKYDWSETKIEKILYKEGAFLVLIDFKRKFKGITTYPFYAVIMPKRDDYDFFIFRKKGPNKKYEVEWEPFYTLWCMKRLRTKPYTVVKADKESPEVVTTINTTLPEGYFEQLAKEEEQRQQKLMASLQRSKPVTQEPPIRREQPKNIYVPKTQSTYAPPTQTTYTPPTPTPTKPKISSTTSSGKDIPQKPKSDIYTPQPTMPAPSKQPVDNLPAMDEDPLFGSEFDITF